MTYEELPEPVQAILLKKFEQLMREQFAEIKHELMEHFLTQTDIAKQWADFYEDTFLAQFHDFDCECEFDSWLEKQGLGRA